MATRRSRSRATPRGTPVSNASDPGLATLPRANLQGQTSWLSSNPAKAAGEIFFLKFAVAWIGFMAVIVGTRAFEWFTPVQYLWVGILIFIPCVALPIAFPPAGEAHLPLMQRYTFKNNVWIFIVTFYALWVWQWYFYKVLCTYYSFSENALRINDVPITLFLITQGNSPLNIASSCT